MKIAIQRQTGPEETTVFEMDVSVLNSEVEERMDAIYRVIDKRVHTVNQRIITAKDLIRNLLEEYPDDGGRTKRVKGTELVVKFNLLVGELFGILNSGVQYAPPRKELV